MPDGLTFGACVRCGRALSNEASAAAGMGPVCRAKASASDSGRLLEDTPVLCDVPPITDAGLICRRLADGRAAANVPHTIKHHSPTGFEWGYGGSGPAELALNAMAVLLRPDGSHMDRVYGDWVVSNDAARLHQDFKWAFIASMPRAGGIVRLENINEWIARKLAHIT